MPLFVYKPKDDELDRKYYLRADIIYKEVRIGYDYSIEGFSHTIEA